MKKKMWRWLLLCSLLMLVVGSATYLLNEYTGEFAVADIVALDCPAAFFTQRRVVFDAITICATNAVPEQKLAYAANVAAEWLDNDGDGSVDEPRLLPHLRSNGATLLMSSQGFSLLSFFRLNLVGVGQDLSAEETNPSGGRRDASGEEIHHLVFNAGWVPLFPHLFADMEGSVLYNEWVAAEAAGYYNYNDPTCNASCKVSEYLYVATAAYLGSIADLASNELLLRSKEELRTSLPVTVALFESTDYRYPTDHWPSGEYAHAHVITQ